MISQFFILSGRGDTLIVRDFRSDLSKNVPEIFFREVKTSEVEQKPIFCKDGINFFFIKRASLYLVATSRFNLSPATGMELLIRISKNIKDLCGVLNEDSIRKNFVLVYEVLDEMVDFGFVQFSKVEEVKQHIVSHVVETAAPRRKKIGGILNWMTKDTVGSDVTKSSSLKLTNELFVDVVEKMNVTFNSSGNVINSEIDGQIQMKSYMAGDPVFTMCLCESVVVNAEQDYGIKLDDVNYDACVNHDNFEFNKTLTVKPPNGTFVAMNYRITKDFNYPFRVHSFLHEKSAFRVELVIKISAAFAKDKSASLVSTKFSVPANAGSVKLELPKEAKEQNAEYLQGENQVEWKVKKMRGQSQVELTTIITLKEEMNSYQIRKDIGPIKLSFEVNNYTASSLFIKYLRPVSGYDAKKPPQRWIRYITNSASYISRV